MNQSNISFLATAIAVANVGIILVYADLQLLENIKKIEIAKSVIT